MRGWLLSTGWERIAEAWCKDEHVIFSTTDAYLIQKGIEEKEGEDLDGENSSN